MKNLLLIGVLAVLLAACEREKQQCPGAIEQSFNLNGFTRVSAGGTFNITIIKGNEFSVKASGCANDLADLDLSIEAGNILEIKYESYKRDRYRVDFTITMPQLSSVNMSGAAKASISGFAGQLSVIRTILSGAAECTVSGTAINAQVELSGSSILNLSGSTESLYGTMSGASALHSYNTNSTEVDLSVSGTSKAYVRPIERLFAESSGESRVYYRGNPPVTHLVTSGNGRIIRD